MATQIIEITEISPLDAFFKNPWLIGYVLEIDTADDVVERENGFKGIPRCHYLGDEEKRMKELGIDYYLCFYAVKYKVLFGVK